MSINNIPRKVRFSQPKKKIRPTGFMLLSSVLPESFGAQKFTLEEIIRGAKEDYNFGKHTIRAAASTLNSCSRKFKESPKFDKEGPLLEVFRRILLDRNSRISIEDFSTIAQQRLRSDSPALGCDKDRFIKVKVSRFDKLSDNPYVLATVRRETKEGIANKGFKVLSRLQKEILKEQSRLDDRTMSTEQGLQKLLECRGDLAHWRSVPGVSLGLTDVYVTDFSGQTIILNSPEGLEPNTIDYVKEMQKRIDYALEIFGSLGDYYPIMSKKNFHGIEDVVKEKRGKIIRSKQITQGSRDRADSSVYIRPDGRATELRVTDLKSFIEGKWGLWAHPEYKQKQLDATIDFYEQAQHPLFNRIADNTMELFGVPSLEDLYHKRII